MTPGSTLRLVVGVLSLLLVSTTLAWAQAAPSPSTPAAPPMGGVAAPPPAGGAAGGGSSAVAVVLVVVGLLVAVGVGVKLYDLKRKREAEAVHLQAQISDALLRDQSLFGLPITPTARVPLWTGSPATIEVAGQVPSAEVRETALRIIRSEAARIRSDFEIEDRLAVVSAMATRVA
jgi:hypothetical protein